MSTLAERLRNARKQSGLSQLALAELVRKQLGKGKAETFSQQTVSAIERGTVLESGFVVHIARALGINPEWLALGLGPATPPDREGNQSGGPLLQIRNRVPVLAWTAITETPPSGKPLREIPLMQANNNTLFALRIRDDAMLSATGTPPSFPPGAYIVCDMDAPCRHADFVIAVVRGSPVFRQLIDDGATRALRPLNGQWPLHELQADDRLIARVTAIWQDITPPAEDAA